MFCKIPRKPIVIFKGDDTNFEGNQKLFFEIESLEALNPARIEFSFLGIKRIFNSIPTDGTIPTDGRFEISFSHEETANFPLGTSFATLTAIDLNNRERTLDNRIAILVTNDVKLAYCSDDDKLISIKIGTINSDIVPPDAEAQEGQAADAKATYEALRELDDKIGSGGGGSSVEVVPPNSSAINGQAADAKETYEALQNKRSLDNLNYTRTETSYEPGYILTIYNLDKSQRLKTVALFLIESSDTGAFSERTWADAKTNFKYRLFGELSGYESYKWNFMAADEYGFFLSPSWNTSLETGYEIEHTITGTNCIYELQYSNRIMVTKHVADKIALESQIPSVVTPSIDGAGKAADAKAVYEEIKGIADNISDLEAADVIFEDELLDKVDRLLSPPNGVVYPGEVQLENGGFYLLGANESDNCSAYLPIVDSFEPQTFIVYCRNGANTRFKDQLGRTILSNLNGTSYTGGSVNLRFMGFPTQRFVAVTMRKIKSDTGNEIIHLEVV